MPLAGFSPGKAATVLYGMMGFSDSEALLAKLGKHTTGKGCLYIKKLADVDQKVLEALVVKSVAAGSALQSGVGGETFADGGSVAVEAAAGIADRSGQHR